MKIIIKYGGVTKSLIAYVHTHQSTNPAYEGVRGFSLYGGDDAIIAKSNGLTFFGINHYGDLYAGVGVQGKYEWGNISLGKKNRNDLLSGKFSIIKYMLQKK